MAGPEEGCCRKSRKSMPQVKGLKELMLPVWQQEKAAMGDRPQILFQRSLVAAGFYHRIMTDR